MEPAFLSLGLAVLGGAAIGLLLSVFGGGGSVLATPLLLYVVGVRDPHVAIGTSAAAVAVHAIYQLVLSLSYALSDFTTAYPIARGFVPIFTALLGMAFLGDRLDGLVLVAIATVSAGILCLATGQSITRGGFVAAAVTGTVRLKLYKGNVIVVGRKSPHSLYSEKVVTFEDDAGAYDQRDAAGFIKLNALRLRLLGRRDG